MSLVMPGTQLLFSPKAGVLDVGGSATRAFVDADLTVLRSIFGEVIVTDEAPPKCDVLFLYGDLTFDGCVHGSPFSLREIIRDSAAKIVVVASPNSVNSYIKAGKRQPYGRANLVMTLDRRGPAFGRFFAALFAKMKDEIPMPVAWAELNPQAQGQVLVDVPQTIFACEIGPVAFGVMH